MAAISLIAGRPNQAPPRRTMPPQDGFGRRVRRSRVFVSSTGLGFPSPGLAASRHHAASPRASMAALRMAAMFAG